MPLQITKIKNWNKTLCKSFIYGNYGYPNLPSNSYYYSNSLFTLNDHCLDNSNYLAPPVKSDVWIIMPLNNFISSSYDPKFYSNTLVSKFLIKLKCSVMSVYKILEINILLNFLNSSPFKLYNIFVFGTQSNFRDLAAWCYSKTLLSWYLIAKFDKLLISKVFVLPVWETSWHNPDKIRAN